MDPKATLDAIKVGLVTFEEQASQGEPKEVLLMMLAEISELIDNLADWIVVGGFVLVAPED